MVEPSIRRGPVTGGVGTVEVTAGCGHLYWVRWLVDRTLEQYRAAYGLPAQCPACYSQELDDALAEADYRRNPDGRPIGYGLLFGTVGTAQAAEDLGIDQSQVRRLCRDGRIQGAVRQGRDWRIPSPVVRLDKDE